LNTKQCVTTTTTTQHTTYNTQQPKPKNVKVAIAMGKKIRTFQFHAKNPARVPGMGSGGSFAQIGEYTCSDHVLTMSVTNAGGGGTICAAFRSGEFVLINIDTGSLLNIRITEGGLSSVSPVGCTMVGDPDDPELVEYMISYNQVACFVDADGLPSRDYNVKFSGRLVAPPPCSIHFSSIPFISAAGW
jgi:hypothetical protein